jgi:putative Mg2+ transporter-C (MgtC) family protein
MIAPIESEMSNDALSRVIQGLVTGIGFLGGGAILKLHDSHEVKGLTTAAGIWMTCAIGISVGLGRLGLAILATFLTWVILYVLEYFTKHTENKHSKTPE